MLLLPLSPAPATTKLLMPVCFAKGKILCAYASQATPAISPQGPVQVVLQLAKAGGRGGAEGAAGIRHGQQSSRVAKALALESARPLS